MARSNPAAGRQGPGSRPGADIPDRLARSGVAGIRASSGTPPPRPGPRPPGALCRVAPRVPAGVAGLAAWQIRAAFDPGLFLLAVLGAAVAVAATPPSPPGLPGILASSAALGAGGTPRRKAMA